MALVPVLVGLARMAGGRAGAEYVYDQTTGVVQSVKVINRSDRRLHIRLVVRATATDVINHAVSTQDDLSDGPGTLRDGHVVDLVALGLVVPTVTVAGVSGVEHPFDVACRWPV